MIREPWMGLFPKNPVVFDVPVDPDRDDARELLVRELSKPEYTSAQPNLIDRIAEAISDWIDSLFSPRDGDFSAWIPVMIVVLVAGAVIAAIVIWGVPRINKRSNTTADLFGDSDTRSAAEFRRDAREAAARGEWNGAIVDGYRAIAKDLAERTVVAVMPGTTAHGFAVRAAAAFPAERDGLSTSADYFDAVRYLNAAGSEEQYRHIESLDRRLVQARPVYVDDVEAVPVS